LWRFSRVLEVVVKGGFMAAGTKFKKGEMFAWGSTLYQADEDCEVWVGAMDGKSTELAQFEIELEAEAAVKMLEAIGADHRYLMVGSDSAIDEDAPEDEEQ
jgi:hypothetical protein